MVRLLPAAAGVLRYMNRVVVATQKVQDVKVIQTLFRDKSPKDELQRDCQVGLSATARK